MQEGLESYLVDEKPKEGELKDRNFELKHEVLWDEVPDVYNWIFTPLEQSFRTRNNAKLKAHTKKYIEMKHLLELVLANRAQRAAMLTPREKTQTKNYVRIELHV